MTTDESPAPATEPASSPEPAGGTPGDVRRNRLIAGVAALLVGIAVTAYVVGRDDDPVSVVENFFAAIVDGDVDEALTYVGRIGYGVPYGERATFLHPDAIADGWRLLDAEYGGGGPVADYVEVTIGDDASSTTGRLEVLEFGGEWNIIDPFIEVEVAAPAFTYIAVNGREVLTADLYGGNVHGYQDQRIELLPGRYTFWGGAPADLLPPEQYLNDVLEVSPPPFVPSPDTFAAVQAQTDAIIDDCVTFTVATPEGCPFGVGDGIEAGDDIVRDVHDVTWEIVERPVVTVDATNPAVGLAVTAAEPGLIRLTASGTKGLKDVRFQADCGVDGGFLRAALRPDGTPEVYAIPALGRFGLPAGPAASTCEYKGKA
ncbi:hypothetical protein [Phytomonospora endophytica]|uniref:Uncharacterized protein n=1 Tax=Phytomonospora endophytica TaxID=714109 RepID=A0A841FPS0_9ACTN|nr:hypothetical protein [Phytomonospora endophytica]MBB6035552.1 hypothetical protein [Phytomonospora endophytica]GIG70085.1 hypothetical protein Pen01_63800 [Phytomonospora endophytica]